MATPSPSPRRTDLDWLRIGAFVLLILYHVGVFYTPSAGAVGAWSPRRIDWLTIPMVALNPWRLLLLFVISGAATRFMAAGGSPGRLLSSRSARLLVPLVFGIVVIVPPQAFVQALERYGFVGGYLEFWGRYLAADDTLCRATGDCMILPTYNHLWFILYLWLYTAILLLAAAFAPRMLAWAEHRLNHALRGPGLMLWPTLWLAAARLLVEPAFPISGSPVTDLYAHTIYLSGFTLGYLMARSDSVWSQIERLRHWALIGALSAYAAMMGLAALTFLSAPGDTQAKLAAVGAGSPEPWIRIASGAVYGADQWLWILAALGYARAHLSNRDGPMRRYLTEAVFPFYIIHQTTISLAGHYLAAQRLPLGVEAALLIAITAASCWAAYEVSRRFAPLRPLFGLKPKGASARARQVSTQRAVRDDVC